MDAPAYDGGGFVPPSRRRRLLERAAIHEAGHAVIGYVLGMKVESISIEAKGSSDGRVSGRIFAVHRSPEIALAGYAAEEVLLGIEAVWELYDLPESDLRAAIEILSGRTGHTITTKDEEFDGAWLRTKTAAKVASRRIHAVSRHLLERGTIQGQEAVERVVGGRGLVWYNRTLLAVRGRGG